MGSIDLEMGMGLLHGSWGLLVWIGTTEDIFCASRDITLDFTTGSCGESTLTTTEPEESKDTEDEENDGSDDGTCDSTSTDPLCL